MGKTRNYKKDDGHSSFGVTRGKPQVMSRWTFWQAGLGEKKPIICSICNRKVYKANIRLINKLKITICKECDRKENLINDYIKNNS